MPSLGQHERYVALQKLTFLPNDSVYLTTGAVDCSALDMNKYKSDPWRHVSILLTLDQMLVYRRQGCLPAQYSQQILHAQAFETARRL